MYLSVTIEGEQQLSRKLRIVQELVKDWTPAFQETAETLKDVFSGEVFDSEGGAIEESWPRLSPAYAYRKARLYPGTGILVATGAMRESFVATFSKDMAVVGNSSEYFKYHQSNAPRTKLPRRVMMKLTNELKTRIVRIFNTYYQEALRA